MYDILIHIFVGTAINCLIWIALGLIAVLADSKHVNFLVKGVLVSFVITLIAVIVFGIYNLVIGI